jgi:opacity protein-like surface antigen
MRIITAIALISCAIGAPADAQKFGLDVRAGAGFPVEEFQGAALRTGGGAGLAVQYRIMPHVVTYAGWDWHLFDMDEPFAGGMYDVVSTGYVLGLQFQHAVRGRLGAFGRAGALFSHVELEDDGGIIADSGHELGWEAGAGLHVAMNNWLALTPGVRYRTFGADLTVNGTAHPVDLSFVTADIGLTWTFGGPPVVSAARTR